MAILIDPPAWPAHGTLWSHLVSDTSYAELHAFARRLGFPRRSFDLDHYDVSAANYDRAVSLGAIPVAGREVVYRLRDSGLRVRQTDRAAITPLRRRQYLVEEWARLAHLLGVSTIASSWTALGEDLIERWNEPHRRYHDERHLEDVLLALDHLETRGERVAPETLLAAWFHDAVYTGAPGGVSDEQASADLAAATLGDLLSPELISRVHALILATTPASSPISAEEPGPVHDAEAAPKTEAASIAVSTVAAHTEPAVTLTPRTHGPSTGSNAKSTLGEEPQLGAESPSRDGARQTEQDDPDARSEIVDPARTLLLDADIWIFASLPKRYAEYAAAVRAEYAHVPDADFAVARASILEAYLARPHLYRTPAARALWETRARANVSREISELRNPTQAL
ncbi:DUF4031 domain-containing protein [Leucobacter sp. USHLN153]|uniref:DUF4031 domain-containing protein n=1 Tax=Leucobacter sp. USHLN153 TaxID=3081268 RepID=UPI003016F03D